MAAVLKSSINVDFYHPTLTTSIRILRSVPNPDDDKDDEIESGGMQQTFFKEAAEKLMDANINVKLPDSKPQKNHFYFFTPNNKAGRAWLEFIHSSGSENKDVSIKGIGDNFAKCLDNLPTIPENPEAFQDLLKKCEAESDEIAAKKLKNFNFFRNLIFDSFFGPKSQFFRYFFAFWTKFFPILILATQKV